MVLCAYVEGEHKYRDVYFKLLCLSMREFFFMQIPIEVIGSLFACGLVTYPRDLTFLHQSLLKRKHLQKSVWQPPLE